MATHLSAKKAIRKTLKKFIVNRNRKTKIKTYIKKSILAINSQSDEANRLFISAQAEIMTGVSKGIIKKNTASRKISRLAKKLKIMSDIKGS